MHLYYKGAYTIHQCCDESIVHTMIGNDFIPNENIKRILPYLPRAPAGFRRNRGCYRLRTAFPQHSPACTAACQSRRIPQELPLQSVGGREEVSLCPCGFVAPCLPRQGQQDAWIALAMPSSRRRLPLHRTGVVPVTSYIRLSSFKFSRDTKSTSHNPVTKMIPL